MTSDGGPAASPPVRANLSSLTGLRWFAALAVFGVHLAAPSHRAQQISAPGVAGVSVFYVLSGFVLVWSQRANDTPRQFWIRRVARVYPTHVVAWLLAIAMIPTGYYVFSGRAFTLGLFLLHSWSPHSVDYYGGNGLAWSLSCEAFFYFMFPFLLPLLRRLGTRGLIAVGLGAWLVTFVLNVVAWAVSDPEPPAVLEWLIFIFPPVRFMEFVIGCVVALLVQRTHRFPVPVSVALVASAITYLLTDLPPDVHIATSLPILPFAALVGALAMRDVQGKWSPLGARWLVVLGQWSFAFYLVHQMVIRLVKHLISSGVLAIDYRYAYILPISLVGAVLAAAVLHYAVERPFERRIRRLADAPRGLPVSG